MNNQVKQSTITECSQKEIREYKIAGERRQQETGYVIDSALWLAMEFYHP